MFMKHKNTVFHKSAQWILCSSHYDKDQFVSVVHKRINRFYVLVGIVKYTYIYVVCF